MSDDTQPKSEQEAIQVHTKPATDHNIALNSRHSAPSIGDDRITLANSNEVMNTLAPPDAPPPTPPKPRG